MATSGTKHNGWGDPFLNREEDREHSPKEQLAAELQEEFLLTFKQTHTTTPLDSRTAFHIQQLDEQADGTYDFQAKRFVGRRPAETYTGTAVETDSGWNIIFDDNPHYIARLISWFKSW